MLEERGQTLQLWRRKENPKMHDCCDICSSHTLNLKRKIIIMFELLLLFWQGSLLENVPNLNPSLKETSGVLFLTREGTSSVNKIHSVEKDLKIFNNSFYSIICILYFYSCISSSAPFVSLSFLFFCLSFVHFIWALLEGAWEQESHC